MKTYFEIEEVSEIDKIENTFIKIQKIKKIYLTSEFLLIIIFFFLNFILFQDKNFQKIIGSEY